MKDFISRYFPELTGLIAQVCVTDAHGGTMDLSTGIERVVELVRTQDGNHNKVIFIGNGGSSSIASHQATDFVKNAGIRAMCFTDASLLTCLSNDLGYEAVFERPIEMFAEDGDVLIAISSSGSSENILKGVRAGRKKNCHIVTMSGFQPQNPLRTMGDINFYLPSRSYGHVEIVHLSLCHCIVDTIRYIKKGSLY